MSLPATSCPHCSSAHVIRHGSFRTRSGRPVPRFACRRCGRTFSPATATPLAYLKKPSRWGRLALCIVHQFSVRQTAALTGVHPSTAFRWRHRLLSARHFLPRPALSGLVTCSERFFSFSAKGQRLCLHPVTGLPPGGIPPGQTWPGWLPGSLPANIRPGGRVPMFWNRACVLVAGDGRHTVALVTGTGRPSVDALQRTLLPVLQPGAALYASRHFRAFCLATGLTHHDADKAGYTVPPMLEQVMACPETPEWVQFKQEVRQLVPVMAELHRRGWGPTGGQFCSWLRWFRGVATRYLANYAAWYEFVSNTVGTCVQFRDEPRLRPGIRRHIAAAARRLLAEVQAVRVARGAVVSPAAHAATVARAV